VVFRKILNPEDESVEVDRLTSIDGSAIEQINEVILEEEGYFKIKVGS
jgi:hypothetical protein